MMEIQDLFNGDDKHLVESIGALLRINEKGSLYPHGIGGFAKELLSSASVRLTSSTEKIDALQLRLNAVEEENDRLRELLNEVLNEVPHGWGDSFSESNLANSIRGVLGDQQ